MPEKPVTSEFTFAEALTGVSAIRDYVRLRRQEGQEEDAILAFFYDTLYTDLIDAARMDREEFNRATAAVALPTWMEEDLR